MMLFRCVLLVPLSILCGCASHGIDFSGCASGTYIVTIRFVDSRHMTQLFRDVSKQELSSAVEVNGFSAMDTEGKNIVVVPELNGVQYKGQLVTLGHEMAHVACGKWHS